MCFKTVVLTVPVLLTALSLPFLFSCGKKTPEKPASARPNVILITLDTTRKDHLSLYGYGRKTTPNLDRFAGKGAVFEAAYASSSWTVPSHVSIMTGLYTKTHGADFLKQQYDGSSPTLAEILSGNGYDSAAFVVSPALNSWYGLNRGFKFYTNSFIKDDPDEKNELDLNDAVCSWLKKDRAGRPFFLFVNYFDPHNPFRHHVKPASFIDPDYKGELNNEKVNIGENPERGDNRHVNTKVMRDREPLRPEDLRHLIALYDEEIAYMDYCLGRLLDALEKEKLLDNALVVILADHGESFTEHFLMSHGRALYAELIDIPMVVYYPPLIKAGQRVKGPVQTEDVFPTVLDYAGVKGYPGVSGVSLKALLGGKAGGGPMRTVFAETNPDPSWTKWFGKQFSDEKRAVISGGWKYILHGTGREELYDLGKDPGENDNLAEKRPDTKRKMKDLLVSFDSSLPGKKAAVAPKAEVPGRTREQLKSLGYLQ